jgi:hypothetical protein
MKGDVNTVCGAGATQGPEEWATGLATPPDGEPAGAAVLYTPSHPTH